MRFSPEWLDYGDESAPELLATTCQLAIEVADVRVTQYVDHRRKRIHERVPIPVYPLAEGLVRNWWQLIAGRTGCVKLKTFREGFAVPDVRFSPDGVFMNIAVAPFEYENPPIHFIESSSEQILLSEFERDLRLFVDIVLEQLSSSDIHGTPLSERWQCIAASVADDEERLFCESAGALGLDPYLCSDADADSISLAASVFSNGSLAEFLAGERDHVDGVAVDAKWVTDQEGHLGSRSELPELADWAVDARKAIQPIGTRPPWLVGYEAAESARGVLNRHASQTFADTQELAQLCGGRNFSVATERAIGLRACVTRSESTVRTLVNQFKHDTSSLFALARAIGDYIVFDQYGRAPITNAQSYRQAVGRAFAAELLAPANVVVGMCEDNLTIEEISDERHVSAMVIEHQIENHRSYLAR
jgi:hypothetical protein